MKLPFTFGTRLIFRLVLPGLVLAAGLAPSLDLALRALGFAWPLTTVLPVAAIFLGWLVGLLDMPIYMVLEGRRGWPRRCWRAGIGRELKRLRGLLRAIRRMPARRGRWDRRRYLELYTEVACFPLRPGSGARTAEMPTRLGNLLAEYEQYPGVKYGLDAIFFWPRLWLLLDQNQREEIDAQQAAIDGLVYVVAILPLLALQALVLGGVEAAGVLDVRLWPDSLLASLLLAAAALLLARAIYLVSLHEHAKFGETFKAVFDQYHEKLAIDPALTIVAERTGDRGVQRLPTIARNRQAWRYLRWHRYRPPGASRNVDIETVQRRPPRRL